MLYFVQPVDSQMMKLKWLPVAVALNQDISHQIHQCHRYPTIHRSHLFHRIQFTHRIPILSIRHIPLIQLIPHIRHISHSAGITTPCTVVFRVSEPNLFGQLCLVVIRKWYINRNFRYCWLIAQPSIDCMVTCAINSASHQQHMAGKSEWHNNINS